MNERARLVQALREGGHTERCHTVPHLTGYSVAEHSWHMAMMLLALHPHPPMKLLMAVLQHDIPERWVGDTPANVKKWMNPRVADELKVVEDRISERLGLVTEKDLVPDEDLPWLKGLDVLEFIMWCDDEVAMGNRHVEGARLNAIKILEQRWGELPMELLEFYLAYSWQRTNENDPLEPLEE